MLTGTGRRGRKSPDSFLVPEEAPALLSCVLLLGVNELCLFMDQLIHNRKYLYINLMVLAFFFSSILKGYIVLDNNLSHWNEKQGGANDDI